MNETSPTKNQASPTLHKLIVQKYGGATLATPEKIKQVAHRIHQLYQSGTQVVVVVSAMGDTTNSLIALAHQISERPALREMDMLLSVGERMSMSLLSMALNDLGCPAISFTGSQAGILTDESHINAQIIDVKGFRVQEALQKNLVVIMAGFQGVSPLTKEITTLGRGGSDTSAVAMAAYLKAEQCEILKDVDGVYTADPKKIPNAQHIEKLNYEHLVQMTSWGAKVLHQNSVKMAQQKNVKLFVGSAADTFHNGTIITHDYQFNQQQALALNSFQNVYSLQTNLNHADFNSYLHQNQIGATQDLPFQTQSNTQQANQNIQFITAPLETLNAISEFEAKQSIYKIINKKLSTVSITFSQSTNDALLKEVLISLKKNNIKIEESFYSQQSLHFLILAQDHLQTLQCLHKQIVAV